MTRAEAFQAGDCRPAGRSPLDDLSRIETQLGPAGLRSRRGSTAHRHAALVRANAQDGQRRDARICPRAAPATMVARPDRRSLPGRFPPQPAAANLATNHLCLDRPTGAAQGSAVARLPSVRQAAPQAAGRTLTRRRLDRGPTPHRRRPPALRRLGGGTRSSGGIAAAAWCRSSNVRAVTPCSSGSTISSRTPSAGR